MEKTIITFSANEQKLIKTGGIECYASNIVSYIEAHFDLGANWSGYDSVRAVWSNDNNMSVISTVLDSNGVCVVPFEVLKTMGIVKVNLVGSILVSGELSDRLTTFPCEALKVSAKAKINGSETAAVTPSQFEQFVAAVISEVEKVTGMTAQAETLPAGSQATARYENGILYLGIPQGIQGERGETGADGNGIASVVYNADYTLTLVFTNGERFTTPPIRGERGPAGQDGRDGTDGRDGADGVTPSLSVGTVTTLPATEDAYVTRTGTDENPVFDFGIPQGPKGDKGDTGEVSLDELSALLPTDTASGSIASIPDGQSVVPVKSLKVTLEPIQDLHGYDKPWSGGDGKNKFGGVYGENFELHIPNETIVTAYVDKACTVAYYDSDGTTRIDYWSINTAVTGGFARTFTMIGDSTYFRFLSASDTPTKMQIELSSSFTGYAPYSNICPISGHTECVTEVSGVNVWDEEWEAGGINTDGSLATNYFRLRSENYISIIPNTAYYFASDVSLGYSSWLIMCFYDGDKNFVSFLSPAVNRTFNTPSNARFMKFCTSDAWNGRTYEGGFSINYPSTDTEYHPYQGTTYTTTLGRTVYGGTLDVVNGVLNVTMGYIASYNGETIGEPWISDRDEYVAGTTPSIGAEVAYTLATPQTYQLTPTEVDLLLGQNNLWTDCGSVEVTYKADVGLYIDKKLSNSGTRSLSMGLTKSATVEAEAEETKTETKAEETKTEEVKTELSKTETETEAVEAKTETDKSETR